MINYKGLRDCHLNIFWQYDGKPHLENNITKAFINSIDSLDELDKRKIFKSLFGLELEDGKLTTEFYLQKKPDSSKILSFPEDSRIMFGFSPTGKCWGFSGQDTKEEKALFEAIKKELSSSYADDDILLNETKKALAEYLEYKRGDSIPDGWILIYINEKPTKLIALENKLYNLDPTQINNHIEKSLFILNDKKKVIYKTYENIIDSFKPLESYATDQFIEYLTILGYSKVDDFNVACSSDESIRQRLSIPFGIKILKRMNAGEVDTRQWNTPRMHVNYEYLREINLIFDKNHIIVSLAFGSTQNSGKAMLERLTTIRLPDDHIYHFKQSFHLLYQRGKNIKSSYIDTNLSINDYIVYWKKNIDLIKTYAPTEAISLYEKMLNDKIITKQNYDNLKQQLKNKKNSVLVVPEIIIEYGWTYEEAASFGIDSFIKELSNKIEITLSAMKLK